MIGIEVSPSSIDIGIITIPNDQLIKGIIAMPDTEYQEVLSGIVTEEKLTIDNIMRIFAASWRNLKRSNLNPAQRNALQEFIKQLII
jgi:hypothetical protein